MKFITFYLYIISELQFYISFNILLDNEIMQTSKRRSFLPLIFIIKLLDCKLNVVINFDFWRGWNSTDGMLVHRSFTRSINFSGTHLYT